MSHKKPKACVCNLTRTIRVLVKVYEHNTYTHESKERAKFTLLCLISTSVNLIAHQ
jgi:hypothetical protein